MSAAPWHGIPDPVSEEPVAVETEQQTTASSPRPTPPWPAPLAEEAFHGLAGDFIRLVGPASEADLAGLLLQFLAAVGCCIGPGPRFLVGGDTHTARLFVVLVGSTARGRKGSSWGEVRRVLGAADPGWASERVMGGLSSGEGLVWSVRDAIYRTEPIKEKGRFTGEIQTVLVDPGVDDKRLLVLESEFARVLRVAERDGSTLLPVMRQGWDSGDLRVLTKTSPAVATGAHIAIVGHVTADELRRRLTDTEVASGLANRVLWVATRRARLLPDGGNLCLEDLTALSRTLEDRITRARTIGEMRRSPEAGELWRDVYAELSRDDVGGLLGSVTARAEAQVLRLSMIFALTDVSREVQPAHLAAALEVWRYCEDSARFIFGDSLGDPVADEILHALSTSPAGLTRNEIRELFARNLSSGRIGAALSALARSGRVTVTLEKDTGGRPAERWKIAPLGDAVNAVNAKRGS